MKPSSILFDLDGTLADTAPDLGRALNIQRARHGLPPLSDSTIRPYASHGSRGLLGVGFGLKPEDDEYSSMRDEYLALYDEVFREHPILFPGMDNVLSELDARGIKWGIVTNKPRRFTIPLLDALGLLQRACSVVSGDDCPRPKPYPDSLMLACRQSEILPDECWYVGDAERDVIAAHAAGMASVVAVYGYLGEEDLPQTWGAHFSIGTPEELLGLLV